MDVELFTDQISEDETYALDDYNEDYLNFEGERCGICTDVVIDRGVLDCCQHWFCFGCIDNWATITSLCPLCQNEFQLITCVPVYDTVGGNKTDDDDDDINPRDDDWFVEGKSNTLSFPSYYIDENAVVCLDGDGCKIRSGSVTITEDSDIDTSIACDSCDKWYHAFCVGFDSEGTCEGSWLCPRCTVDESSQKSDNNRVSVLTKTYQNGLEIASGDHCLAEASFSGRVSVSVADEGETAVVISLVDRNQESRESNESVLGCSKDGETALLSCSVSDMPNLEALPGDRNSVEPNSVHQEMELSLSPISTLPAELKKIADDALRTAPRHINNKTIEIDASVGLGLDLPMDSDTPDMKDNDTAEDHVPVSLEPNNRSEDLLPADKKLPAEMDVLSRKSMTCDEKETISGIARGKRKHKDIRDADEGERKANSEAEFSRKKVKAERNSQPVSLTDQTAVSVRDDSTATFSQSGSRRNNTAKSISKKENSISDIMDIVKGTDRKKRNLSDVTPKEGESGLRLKKIVRRAGEDKDSLELVQELRKKIREAVRNKSSKEIGQELFDPKLLDAFRAALAGSVPENRKQPLDVKAKKSLLQKGKIRENLTKKIYGNGGKRQRAWTRECEVEFWKHRCTKASKPEKVQTLKSVLDLLRDNSDSTKKAPRVEEEAKGSVLSRLYLADASVFPRKNDIKPVANLEQNKEGCSTGKSPTPLTVDQPDRNPQQHRGLSQVIALPLDGKETKKSAKGKVAATSALKPSEKGDKKKWALELLARKTAASGKNMQEKEEDSTILKGNYTLLAQLPKEMRPVLAPSRHNKIPMSVRQAQLYRLTEHFLKKANMSLVSRAAETELAVADAVNIEKGIADKSNSKLVYANLCSQELLRRPDNVNSERATEEEIHCSTSERLSEETNNSSLKDLSVDEALRKAGLVSDSPPNSPDHFQTDDINEEEEPDSVLEVDSNQELDIYGDFEYNLEDDDFIGAGSLNISNVQPEQPKIKLLFSSIKAEEPNVEALAGFSDPLESRNNTNDGGSTVDSINSPIDKDEEPSLAECEELYGPEKEPLIKKYPEIAISIAPVEQAASKEPHGENGDCGPHETEKNNNNNMESKQSKNATKKEKKSSKQSEQNNSMVMKKVEAYVKEHIRPLCKSGVITVEQYRWAVNKTTEKVMKYHSKEKNANFLIKEGEKVKKLAEQYVEAAQDKTGT
ncbi:hypothetical protein ACP275_05G114900 [Erythranthe tilingii]